MGDNSYWADKRGIYAVNGQLISCLGRTAPKVYNEQTKTFNSLDNLQSLSFDDGCGMWYANGYYFYGTQVNASGQGCLYYSSNLSGTFTKINVYDVVLSVGYINNQYIFLTKKGIDYSSDLTTVSEVSSESISEWDSDYVRCSIDLCVKNGYIYRTLINSSTGYWGLYRWKLPLSNNTTPELVCNLSTSDANKEAMNLYLGDNYFITNVRDNSNYTCKMFSYKGSVVKSLGSLDSFIVNNNILFGVDSGGYLYAYPLSESVLGTYSRIQCKEGYFPELSPICNLNGDIYVESYPSVGNASVQKTIFYNHSIKLPTISIGVNSYIKIK